MKRPAATSKLLLVEDRRGAVPADRPSSVRRYRLARVRVGVTGVAAGGDRFAYLSQPHD